MFKSALTGVVLCVAVCGCGDSGRKGSDPVYPVSGVVTFNGQPAAGADVTFFNAEKKRSAFGRTNEKGEYQLTTFTSNDGAVEGKSSVTIAKFVAPTVTVPEPDVDSEAYQPPGVGEDATPPPKKSEIPEHYGDMASSGLIGVVNGDSPNTIDFELK